MRTGLLTLNRRAGMARNRLSPLRSVSLVAPPVSRSPSEAELVEPGVEVTYRWHPDEETERLVDNGEFTNVSCSL
ncbi:MAG TPA: hypothetical protein VGD71_36020 [Kribbella sp.]